MLALRLLFVLRATNSLKDVDARRSVVDLTDDEVTLSGDVASSHERASAERAAMHATGITRVDNRIRVVWPEAESINDR